MGYQKVGQASIEGVDMHALTASSTEVLTSSISTCISKNLLEDFRPSFLIPYSKVRRCLVLYVLLILIHPYGILSIIQFAGVSHVYQ